MAARWPPLRARPLRLSASDATRAESFNSPNLVFLTKFFCVHVPATHGQLQSASKPHKRRQEVVISAPRGKVVGLEGPPPPKRVGLTEWDSLEKAEGVLQVEGLD
jgi:hypothetical protein